MINRIAIIIVSTLLAYSCTSVKSKEVSISERQILVNGKPYLIKGVCYTPIPKGSNILNYDGLTEDLALMVEAGINTIRIYKPIDNASLLDQIHAAGIKVIVGFGYNQDGFYDILSGSFIDYVNNYKTHEAILFWELGNEFNYHPEWFEGDMNKWYKALNDAADIIHRNDSIHPVASAHGELPKKNVLDLCPNIDIWGMNVYRWDNPEGIFKEWTALSDKPMYLSEAGAGSYMTATSHGYEKGRNQDAQANATKAILDDIFNATDVCSGVAIFAFVDEWWKAGDINSQDTGGWAPNSSAVPYDGTANEEYWGIVDIDRNKKKAFKVVKDRFTKP